MDKEYERFFDLFSGSTLAVARQKATKPEASIKEIIDYVEGIQSGEEFHRNFHHYMLFQDAIVRFAIQDQYAFYGFDSFKGLKKYGKGRPYRFSELNQFVWDHYCKVENEWGSSTSPVHKWLQDVGRIIATTRSEEKEFLINNGLEEFCTENYSEMAVLGRISNSMFPPRFDVSSISEIYYETDPNAWLAAFKRDPSTMMALSTSMSLRESYITYLLNKTPPLKSREPLLEKVLRNLHRGAYAQKYPKVDFLPTDQVKDGMIGG